VGRDIVLIDKDKNRAEAEAKDILHAAPFAHPLNIRAGGYEDLNGCRLVVLAAGVSQKPGESRLELLKRNAAVFQQILPEVLKHAGQAVLVIATNPVDIMTHLTAHYAVEFEVPAARVIGSGTMLDTARFRSVLGEHIGVDPQHVHGYVIGEHGDSEVLTWSLTTVGAMPVTAFCRAQQIALDDAVKRRIDERVRNAAYRIIEGKGATYYGIGSAISKLAEVILHDQRSILTVSTPMAETVGLSNVSVSLPHLVGGKGILATFPLQLSEPEKAAFQNSVSAVKESVAQLV
jgi:L-lactate dehydrogenase